MFKQYLSGALLVCASATSIADSQKPSDVNGLSATSIASDAIRITWNKPWDDTGIAGYNIYRNNFYYKTVSDTQYVDNDVTPNSNYRYGIVAFDQANNFSMLSAIVAVDTDNGSSTTSAPPPPQAGGNLSQPGNLRHDIINGNSVRVYWDRPATGNAIGYNVYRDNNYVVTVNDQDYVTSSLDSGRDYNFHVVAIDANVNFSRASDALTVNTGSASPAQTEQVAHTQFLNGGSNNNTSGVPDGYRQVFADEFQGNSLDNSKWNTRYRWGPDWTINNERQYYVDYLAAPNFGHSPFEFDGEHMTINATRTPDWLLPKTNWQPYMSGLINSWNKFSMRYGYVEMRAKLPKGQGLWPAFWLLHQNDNDRKPEIDIMELHGQRSNLVYQTYHHFEGENLRSSPSYEAWGPDYSQDFHTYAVKWEPGMMIWYIDGHETNRYQNGNVSWENMYILLNLAVGGGWPGDPDGSTPFPARLTVDYIRAYQRLY